MKQPIIRFLAEVTGMHTTTQASIATTTGIVGALLSYAFGGWTGLLEIFLLALMFDYGTGVAASLKEKKGLNSEIGFWGLIKKVLMIGAVYFGHRIDLAFELNYVMNGAISMFLANELISIGENYGRIGLPFSSILKPIIQILRDKGGGTIGKGH